MEREPSLPAVIFQRQLAQARGDTRAVFSTPSSGRRGVGAKEIGATYASFKPGTRTTLETPNQTVRLIDLADTVPIASMGFVFPPPSFGVALTNIYHYSGAH